MKIDSYEKDLDTLLADGKQLLYAMIHECHPEEFASTVEKSREDGATEFITTLPSFENEYQAWYSEAQTLVRQLIPDRLSDFIRYYEKPKSRKEITNSNYTIEDYLQGTRITLGSRTLVDRSAAIPRFRQQLSIVKSIRKRFRSSLFDIRQLAQADIFDSELDAARELARNKFNRAAGAVAGVVLERHLKEVCANHNVTLRKKAPQISDLNDALKKADVIDIPQWRSMQLLGDIRNRCAHDKQPEPTAEQVSGLLDGVSKVTKTLF